MLFVQYRTSKTLTLIPLIGVFLNNKAAKETQLIRGFVRFLKYSTLAWHAINYV